MRLHGLLISRMLVFYRCSLSSTSIFLGMLVILNRVRRVVAFSTLHLRVKIGSVVISAVGKRPGLKIGNLFALHIERGRPFITDLNWSSD